VPINKINEKYEQEDRAEPSAYDLKVEVSPTTFTRRIGEEPALMLHNLYGFSKNPQPYLKSYSSSGFALDVLAGT
jgi:hypothetical protein